MSIKNSAMVYQALLDGLIHLRYEVLSCPEDFSAFSDVSDEWFRCESIISDMLLQTICEFSDSNVFDNLEVKE